jgi:putative spermidine/putrescine transport system permease protein
MNAAAPPWASGSRRDGGLKTRVRRSEGRYQRLMLALMAPSVIFVSLFFAAPIGLFLFRSIDNPEVPGSLGTTLATLESWDGDGLPGEESFKALSQDLGALAGTTQAAILARRLNYNISGFRRLIMETAKNAPRGDVASYRERLIELDPKWGELRYWAVIQSEGGRLTPFYLLSALDLTRAPDGSIVRGPPETTLFLQLFARTFWISFIVTLSCLLIGFPVAYVMASSSSGVANVLLMLVLLPFWTSLLVRTTAWVILLQNEGLVNQTLLALGILSEPLPLIFNRLGLYIAMIHVLLPFMILPVYSVLKGIPGEHMKAAASLGAKPLTVFRRIYLPQAMPGIIAGGTLIFVISLGYYVTPALVGGPRDQMVGYFIAHFTNRAVNWGMASALGTLLLATVAVLYLVLSRLVGFERLKVR